MYVHLRRFAAVVAPPSMEPDDLLQEAFARALRVRPLEEFDDVASYLGRTMLNLASNARRSAGRRYRALVRLRPVEDASAPSYPSDLAVLDALRPDVRAVLYLAEVESWTYAEIGAFIGCSETAARTRASRGRKALRALLESDDG
jgi:RNA polymerase sigma-70 factor (ECF subfamily)